MIAPAFAVRTLVTEDGAELVHRVRRGNDPIVLLHALGCDGSMWDGVIAALPADRGLIVPDARGHGGSTLGWKGASVELWASDVAAIVAACGIARPAVAGLSMGGHTALAVAAMHPGLARGFGFLNHSAQGDDDEGRKRRADSIASIQRTGARAWAEAFAPRLFSPALPGYAARCERYVATAERAGPAGLVAAMQGLAGRPDRRAALQHLHARVAVVAGEADEITPLPLSREIAEGAQGSRLVVLPRVAHLSAVEAPVEVADVLREL